MRFRHLAFIVAIAIAAARSFAADLKNADFEASPDSPEFGWVMPKKGPWNIESGEGRNGTRGLVFRTSDTNAPYCWPYQEIEIPCGGHYAFGGWVCADDLRCDRQGATMFVSWREPDGRPGEHWPAASLTGTNLDGMRIETSVNIPKGVRRVRLHLILRNHSVGKAVFDDVEFYRLDCKPRDPETWLKRNAEGRVHLDEFGRTIADGKPFFPLGVYCGPLSASNVLRVAESPFNTILPYERPGDGESLRALDMAAEKNVRVIYQLIDFYVGNRHAPGIRTVDDERSTIEGYVRRFKDHPALLAWYLSDELPRTRLADIERHAKWLRELDPEHPTFNVFIADSEETATLYAPTADIVGTDPYPIGRRGQSDIGRCAAETKMVFDGVRGKRAVWMVPQIFDWHSLFKSWSDARPPTRAEMRNMFAQMIAAGANGLIAYIMKDESFSDGPKTAAECWRDICAVAAEVAEKFPILLSVEPAPSVAERPYWMYARAYRLKDSVYALVVNATYNEMCGRIRLSDGFVRDLKMPPLAVQWLEYPIAQER